MNTLLLSQLLFGLACVFSLSESSTTCREVKLESKDFGYNRVTVSDAAEVISISPKNVHSNSACSSDVSYGMYGPDVWVNKGCRADFTVCFIYGANREVECSSKSFETKACHAASNIRSVVLQKQLSKTPCVQGVNFDVVDSALEVRNGCRARFVVGYTLD